MPQGRTKQWSEGEVVVLGHTHVPEDVEKGGKSYYNSGSWTRYVTSADLEKLKLEDLKDEDKFQYQLNYVRVQQSEDGKIHSSMICFEKS